MRPRSTLPTPLRGIVPPLITPLTSDRKLDVAALARLVRRNVEAGIHGLFSLGSTGETPSLDRAMRRAVIKVTCESANDAVPVLVNISDTCLEESLSLAEHAQEQGAVALAVCPPYYFPLDQNELADYVGDLANRINLPIFVYNIPQFAHTEFKAATVARLAAIPNVAGLKNSNGSVDYVREVRSKVAGRPDFTVLVGSEEILAEGLAAGAHGGVCGGANMFPRLFVKLFEAASNGNSLETKELQSLVKRVADVVYGIGPRGSAYLRGLKGALSLLGVAGDTLAAPFESFDQSERAQLRERMDELIPLVRRAEQN